MKEEKIKEAEEILKSFGVPVNKVAALTLLALCWIKPEDNWGNATRKSLTLTKDIIEFVRVEYNVYYAANTRESFRKEALRPFLENKIAVLNPDDPTLTQTSSKTHYALSNEALNTIKKFKTPDWEEGLIIFNTIQLSERKISKIFLREISISNFKSIDSNVIELGRFNVFIGANGCGKSNILEALAMASAAYANDLSAEGIINRGMRLARPDLTTSAFGDSSRDIIIDINLEFEKADNSVVDFDLKSLTLNFKTSLVAGNKVDAYSTWIDIERSKRNEILGAILDELLLVEDTAKKTNAIKLLNELFEDGSSFSKPEFGQTLSEFGIFDLNTKILRGISPAESRKSPLGLNGEGLDLLIADFNSNEKESFRKYENMFPWLEEIITDKNDKLKLAGLKPGRGTSTLYFKDRYISDRTKAFSAENSNEGILHVLFYLALFISNRTPSLFGIDNIETALNPKLCQKLIKELAQLSKERGKQVLITTHNPAVLDGLNLMDEDQRLFEVFRNDKGHTVSRRIKFKNDLSDKKYKLSQMWLNGLIGGIPQDF